MASAQRPQWMLTAEPGVYAPQADSFLMVAALERAAVPFGARVLDLCTGTGIVAMAAAANAAAEVTAMDISPSAVHCARANAAESELSIDVVLGGLDEAKSMAPFDVVLCNPPYVPSDVALEHGDPLSTAWDAGPDGRKILEPLCASIDSMLTPNGFALIVHSEFSGIEVSLRQLRNSGLKSAVVERKTIPFGPVLQSRAQWLEMRGLVERGRREEEIVVIRADRSDVNVA